MPSSSRTSISAASKSQPGRARAPVERPAEPRVPAEDAGHRLVRLERHRDRQPVLVEREPLGHAAAERPPVVEVDRDRRPPTRPTTAGRTRRRGSRAAASRSGARCRRPPNVEPAVADPAGPRRHRVAAPVDEALRVAGPRAARGRRRRASRSGRPPRAHDDPRRRPPRGPVAPAAIAPWVHRHIRAGSTTILSPALAREQLERGAARPPARTGG